MTLKSFALDSPAFWLLLSFALCPASQAGRREVPRYLTGEALNYQAILPLLANQALALEGRMTVHPCRLARSAGARFAPGGGALVCFGHLESLTPLGRPSGDLARLIGGS